jgi:hypothetical protein
MAELGDLVIDRLGDHQHAVDVLAGSASGRPLCRAKA